jgi:ABC-type multidrug transport system ATPase subunit
VILVGDQRFHARCREHLFDRRSDRALVLASHDASFVQEVCDSALVLSGGKAHYFDNVPEAMQAYEAFEAASRSTSSQADKAASPVPEGEADRIATAATPHESERSLPDNEQNSAESSNEIADVTYPNDGTSPEEIVDALYRHVLGRPPDPSGLSSHVERLKENGLNKELPYLLRDFLNSEEARARLVLQNQT